jgi:hypothetical protein
MVSDWKAAILAKSLRARPCPVLMDIAGSPERERFVRAQ